MTSRRRAVLARRRRDEVVGALRAGRRVWVDGRRVYLPWMGEPFVAYERTADAVLFSDIHREVITYVKE